MTILVTYQLSFVVEHAISLNEAEVCGAVGIWMDADTVLYMQQEDTDPQSCGCSGKTLTHSLVDVVGRY